MDNKNIVVAVDGPAGAGKSTISKQVANVLNIEYIDTGAMYRALTLKVLKLNLNPESKDDVISILENTLIDFRSNHIFLDNNKVDDEIRDNVINKSVSYIARVKEVREALVKIQQQLAKEKSVIMDGRDIGTVVLPDADYKFFVTASVDERAKRRYKELLSKGDASVSFDQIKKEIHERDLIDSTRKISPLTKADDAYVIDTTNKTIDESVDDIINIIKGGK